MGVGVVCPNGVILVEYYGVVRPVILAVAGEAGGFSFSQSKCRMGVTQARVEI